MIKIIMRNREKEIALVTLLAGETSGQMFTNFPIKGMTRKSKGMYRVINSPATIEPEVYCPACELPKRMYGTGTSFAKASNRKCGNRGCKRFKK